VLKCLNALWLGRQQQFDPLAQLKPAHQFFPPNNAALKDLLNRKWKARRFGDFALAVRL
jgi:hypothetical protein